MNVSVPVELFNRVTAYFLLDEKTEENEKAIKKLVNEKLDKMIAHKLYSDYKNKSLTDEEREKARKDYLDHVGYNDNFRW